MGGKHLTQKELFYIENPLACNVSKYQIAKELDIPYKQYTEKLNVIPQHIWGILISGVGANKIVKHHVWKFCQIINSQRNEPH